MTTYENYAYDMALNLPEALEFAKLYFKEHCKYATLDEHHGIVHYDISEAELSKSVSDAIEEYSMDKITLIAYIECPLEVEVKISGGILA